MKSTAAETAETIMSRIRKKHHVGTDDVAPAVKQAAAASKRTTQKERAPASAEPAVAASPAVAPAPAPPAPPAPKPAPTPKEHPLCACGCGERTRGGTYRPGHDSKHRSAQVAPKEKPDCKCGCGAKTKGGTFLPGHDAKYHSMLRKKEQDEADARAKARGEAPLSKKSKKATKPSDHEATAA